MQSAIMLQMLIYTEQTPLQNGAYPSKKAPECHSRPSCVQKHSHLRLLPQSMRALFEGQYPPYIVSISALGTLIALVEISYSEDINLFRLAGR